MATRFSDTFPRPSGAERSIDITAGPRSVLAQIADRARQLTGARRATVTVGRAGSAQRGTREHGLIAAPLADGRGRRLGVLRAWDKPGGFTRSDETILAVLARVAPDLVGAALAYRQATRSGEQFRALVRSSPLPIVQMDEDGRCLVWNPAAERFFGWTADEVLGRRCPAIPEALKREFGSIFRRVFDGEDVPEVDTLRLLKDGSLADVSISFAPVRSNPGAVSGLVAVVADRGEVRLLRRQLHQLRVGMLSPGERAVVRLIREGSSYRAIARALGRSEGTVRTLVHRAYRKLGVHRRSDLPALD